MHYRYLTLFTAFFAVCNMAVAQKQLPQLPDYILHHNTNRPASSGYRARLIAWTMRTDGQPAIDSTWYNYSAGRGEDRSIAPTHYDSSLRLNPFSSQAKYSNTFDAHNNITLSVQVDSIYNCTFNCSTTTRKRYMYNSAGQLVSDTTEVAYTNSSNWEANEYEYDTHDNLLRATNLQYNTPDALFYKADEVAYAYDASDNMIEIVTKQWAGSNLNNLRRYQYAYNAAGILTNLYAGNWNNSTSRFDTTDAVYQEINTDNTIAAKYSISFTPPAQWDTTSRVIYYYDANKNLLKERTFWWNRISQVFVESGGINYTYNSNNNVIYSEPVYLDPSTQTWHISGIPFHYYWESFTPADVAQLKQQGGKLSIYPVPAANTLNLNISWQVKQNYTILVADMQGRVVMYDNNKTLLDVSAIPAGNYNIVLKGDRGAVLHAQFVVVH